MVTDFDIYFLTKFSYPQNFSHKKGIQQVLDDKFTWSGNLKYPRKLQIGNFFRQNNSSNYREISTA